MEQRVSLITLGVADLPRAKAFYEHLGWHGQEVDETVFLQAGGLVVVLWGRDQLAADSGLPTAVGTGFTGIVLAHNVRSNAAVDDILASAERGGAHLLRPGRPTFYGGYSGTFADPDGHIWEIVCNPGLPLAEDGTITIPDFSR